MSCIAIQFERRTTHTGCEGRSEYCGTHEKSGVNSSARSKLDVHCTGRLPCLEPDDLMMYMSNGPTRASELNLTGERISCEFTGVNSTFCEVNILKAPDKIGVIIEKNDLSLEFRNS